MALKRKSPKQVPKSPKRKSVRATERSVLLLTAKQARSFFLKPESYCRLDLPPYFDFGRVLRPTEKILASMPLSSLSAKPQDHEGVNYTIYSNKDGRYAWRPFQLIHPALYVALVQKLTEPRAWKAIQTRFGEFASNPKIRCLSIPQEALGRRKDQAAQVHHWWEGVEQASIELALDWGWVFQADITDCYGSIYTHSIAWAMHGKKIGKLKKHDSKLLGNALDECVRNMQQGQTNGIPQGSVLLDLIAELVLGYVDLELSRKLSKNRIQEFQIVRYRDDYRIFVNDSRTGERILKLLTEELLDIGLKLNASKTTGARPVVTNALKADKLAWLRSRQWDSSIQKHLLLIHSHASDYPNAGSLIRPLEELFRRLSSLKSTQDPMQLLSITVDIAYNNPRCVAVCAAITSKLLSLLPSKKLKLSAIERVRKKLSQLPNTGHLELWLQRANHSVDPDLPYEEPLCAVVQGKAVTIWNSNWISSAGLKKATDPGKLINKQRLKKMRPVIRPIEFRLFWKY